MAVRGSTKRQTLPQHLLPVAGFWNVRRVEFLLHGKGPCDGAGGTVKRLAARASLQRAYDNHITTLLQLFQFASTNIPSVGPAGCGHKRGDEGWAIVCHLQLLYAWAGHSQRLPDRSWFRKAIESWTESGNLVTYRRRGYHKISKVFHLLDWAYNLRSSNANDLKAKNLVFDNWLNHSIDSKQPSDSFWAHKEGIKSRFQHLDKYCFSIYDIHKLGHSF